ncbi:MAG: RidA family protein [Rhodothermales bacterium]|nr:RidA family protein [Rhodothermales bacterium]
MTNEPFFSENAPEPVGAYPHARRAGPFLFLSGVGPRQRGKKDIPGVRQSSSGEIVDYDIEIQARSTIENVVTILRDAGLTWNDLVDVSVFLTDMKRDFQAFNRIYAEYCVEHKPSRTTVEVGALPTPIAVELKCIAILPSSTD